MSEKVVKRILNLSFTCSRTNLGSTVCMVISSPDSQSERYIYTTASYTRGTCTKPTTPLVSANWLGVTAGG